MASRPWNGLTLSGVPIVAKRLKTDKVDYSKDAPLFNSSYVDNDDEVHCTLSFKSPKGVPAYG